MMRKNIFIHTRRFLSGLLAVLLLSLTAIPANAIDQIAHENITVNPYDFTMNVTTDMEYSDDNGETWTPCTDNQNVEDRQGETLLVRFASMDNFSENDAYTVIVPVRGEAPVLTIDNETEYMDSTAAMEYSSDNGTSWVACLDDMCLSELTGSTLLMRYACDGINPASKNVSVTVPERNIAPDITVNNYAEVLTAAGVHPEYLTENAWIAIPAEGLDVSDMAGLELAVRESYDADHFTSLPVLVKVPEQGTNPDLTIDWAMQTLNTTADMEYSRDGGKTWIECGPNMDISNLFGQTIIIRNHGNVDFFPSSGVSVTLPVCREAPMVEVDSTAQTVSSDKGTEFSCDSGKTWTALEKPLNTADYLGKTILFRFPATGEDFASRTVAVVISNHPGAPVLIFDSVNETLNTTPDMEYSTNGGKTWHPCTGPMNVSDRAGKEILIRYPGSGDIPPSEPATVTIPARRMAPNATVSGNMLTNTDKTMEYRLLPDGKWTTITGTTVRGLAPGTYEIRWAAAATEMASEVQTAVIADLNANGSKLSLLNKETHIPYITGRTITQAAPNANITRAEVAEILYRLLVPEAKAEYETSASPFHDVSADAWYGPAVSTLANMGALSIYQGAFEPNRSITRGELAAILASFCGTAGDFTEDWFTDISGSWAQEYINQAAAAGLVYGYTDGTFRPDQNITRAETIVMVNRILGRSVAADTVVNGYKTFDDVSADAWYYWDIVEASNLHTFQRDGAAEVWTALG